MKLEDYTGSSLWGNLRILWANIDSIDSDNDTADITVLDENKEKTDETFENVIFFYNCQDDMTKRSNGALEGSSMAFEKNDQVYVGYDLSGEDKSNLKIIGRLDGLKSCGESVILLIVDDSAQYEQSDSVTYVLKQYTIRKDFTLLELEKTGAKVSKYHNGTALVIQGSEDKNNSVATVADKFGFSERWDDVDGKETSWRSTVSILDSSYIVGSNSAWNPDEGMSTNSKARRNYIINDDGEITSCYYAIKTDVLGTCYCYIGAYATNRNLLKQWIKYRESVGENEIIGSTYWTDYETGAADADGYEWKYHRVIAVVSKTAALLMTKKKVQAESGFITRPVTVTVESTEHQSSYGLCYNNGCYIGAPAWYGVITEFTTLRRDTHEYGIRKEDVTYHETLEIGTLKIEELQYNIKVEEAQNDLNFYPFSTTEVSRTETDTCHGDCKSHEVTCTDSFSGGVTCDDFERWNVDFNVRTGNYCWYGTLPGVQVEAITIPAGGKRTETGGKDIHILGFDNYQGEKYIILFYEKADVALSNEWDSLGRDITYSYTINTKYYMYIKSDTSTVKTLLTTKTETYGLDGGTTGGSYVSKVSCQINRGMAVYTYCIHNAETGTFEKRVVGYRNLTNSKYTTGQSKEYETRSSLNVSETYWQYKIAVGLTKG